MPALRDKYPVHQYIDVLVPIHICTYTKHCFKFSIFFLQSFRKIISTLFFILKFNLLEYILGQLIQMDSL